MKAEELLREYYGKIAPYHDQIFHGDTEGEFYEIDQYVLKLLQQWCPDNARMILDVGCGTGYWLKHLTRIGHARVVGVDISSEMLAIATAQYAGNPRTDLYQGNVCKMDFLGDCMFDFTFCPWVFQYLIDKQDFRNSLKEIVRVTKPGGTILIAEDSPPTKAPFTDCLIKKDELGGIYFYEDEYEGMTLPVYRRLLDSDEMMTALTEQGLDLLSCEQKISLKVYVACRQK